MKDKNGNEVKVGDKVRFSTRCSTEYFPDIGEVVYIVLAGSCPSYSEDVASIKWEKDSLNDTWDRDSCEFEVIT